LPFNTQIIGCYPPSAWVSIDDVKSFKKKVKTQLGRDIAVLENI
jgi:hypothetical protein